MRLLRRRWVLVPMVVLIAGCLPQPALELPASLLQGMGGEPATFTVQPPPAGATGQDVVAALRQDRSFPSSRFRGRSVVVFGLLDCHGVQACLPGPAGTAGGARTVWLVLYPDCTAADGTTGGWVVVDAIRGAAGGSVWKECGP